MLLERVLNVLSGCSLQGFHVTILERGKRRVVLVGVACCHGGIIGAIVVINSANRATHIERVNSIARLLGGTMMPAGRVGLRESICLPVLFLDDFQGPVRHVTWESSREGACTMETTEGLAWDIWFLPWLRHSCNHWAPG
jgi:hypothetical protein